MSEPTQLWGLDATAQADLVASGQVTASELVEAAIARIEALDPALNAVVHPRFERARIEARGQLPDGPFRGVPIVLKDLGCVSAGDPDTQGNRFLASIGHTAAQDATLTRLLRGAGFVIVGRTNAAEFGLVSTTEPTAFGPTHNPWDVARTPGGSSGGSAVAVATGMAAIAQGTDGGGSLRMPATHCGLFALKPSRGRVAAGPGAGDSPAGHNVFGVLTRTVRDTAGVLDLISVPQPGEANYAPAGGSFAAALAAPVPKLRIGLMDVPEVAGYPVDERVNEAAREAASVLESLGHVVVEAFPDAMLDPDYRRHFLDLLSPSVTVLVDALSEVAGRPLRRDELEEVTWFWYEHGKAISAAQHVRNELWCDDFRRRMAAWWAGGFDLLLSPVVPNPPPLLGFFDGAEGIRRSLDILTFTPQFNTTGQPAVSVPMRLTDDGLPVGVQLGAAYGREDLLLQVSAQLEQTAGWADRHPPQWQAQSGSPA